MMTMVRSWLPGRLDWYLLRRGLTTIAMVAGLIIIVAIAVDFLINIGTLARGTGKKDMGKLIASLYWHRLPQLANVALPVASVISCLLICAPMLKRGEFIALSATGVSPARSVRVLLVLVLIVGAIDTVIADLVSPHAIAETTKIEDQLQNQRRLGRVWQVPQTRANWFAGRAQGLWAAQIPTIDKVVIASSEGLTTADRLVWIDDHWRLEGHLLRFRITQDGRYSLERPSEIALEGELLLPFDPQQLYRHLLPRYTMTGPELMMVGGKINEAYAWARWSRLFIPLLAALVAIPMFARFVHRDAMVSGCIKAIASAAIPVLIVIVGGMVADTSAHPPMVVVVTALVVALVPSVWFYLVWRL
ncbi:MAG: LptF/LptG family permease [Planctomycetes bacterium]|nr:LptF/LptG family permease [Planctomycetota bacterium]